MTSKARDTALSAPSLPFLPLATLPGDTAPLLLIPCQRRSSGPLPAPSHCPPANAAAPPDPAASGTIPPTGCRACPAPVSEEQGLQVGIPWPALGAGAAGCIGRRPRRRPPPVPDPRAWRPSLGRPEAQGGGVPWLPPQARPPGVLAVARPRPVTLHRPSWHPSRPPQMDPFQTPPE